MRVRGLSCLFVFGLFTGCAQPPTAEVEIAVARIEMAQKEGASEYASEILLEAEEAMSRAQTYLSDPNRYREAVREAATACLRADEARGRAIEQKDKIARSADRSLREIRALLEESRSLGAERNALESYVTRADTIQSKLEDGSVADAFAASETLKQELLAWLKGFETSL